MCGRFAVTTDPKLLAEKIHAIDEATSARNGSAGPNYNVAPTNTIATVVSRHTEPEDDPTRRLRLMRWGLVPPWAKAGPDGAPDNKGPLLINARADKVATSPAFRSSAKSKRCLVPMTGWYEWRANPDSPSGKKARKTPFFLTPGDDRDRSLTTTLKPAHRSSTSPPRTPAQPPGPGYTSSGWGEAPLVEALESADVGRQRQAGCPHRAQHRRRWCERL